MNKRDYPPALQGLFISPGIDWEAAKDAASFVALCLLIAVLAGLA